MDQNDFAKLRSRVIEIIRKFDAAQNADDEQALAVFSEIDDIPDEILVQIPEWIEFGKACFPSGDWPDRTIGLDVGCIYTTKEKILSSPLKWPMPSAVPMR